MTDDPRDEEGTEGSPGPVTDEHGLPHWTDQGTSQIQMIGDDDLSAWSGLQARGSSGEIPEISIEGDVSAERQFFGGDEQPAAPAPQQRPAEAPPRPPRRRRPPRGAEPQRVSSRPQPQQPPDGDGRAPAGRGGSELTMRVLTAVGMAAVALIALAAGQEVSLVLVTVLLVVSASELFVSLRSVGYAPATLLGLAAVGAMPLGVFWRGEGVIPLALFLFMVFGALWYLLGVQTERPVPNLGVTALGVIWIGVLGSFAALLLDFYDGVGLLFAAILLTVANDIGAYFVGRAAGRSPLTEYSPNKSVEGFIGGAVATIVVGALIGVFGLTPFDSDPFGTTDAMLIALAVAIVAPLGDLTESIVKRDLGVKDMGAVLPGHGGLLDRFDGMLFAMPTVYYMARVLL